MIKSQHSERDEIIHLDLVFICEKKPIRFEHETNGNEASERTHTVAAGAEAECSIFYVFLHAKYVHCYAVQLI